MSNSLTRRAFLGQTGTVAALAIATPPLRGEHAHLANLAAAVGRTGFPQVRRSRRPRARASASRIRAAYGPVVELNDTDKINAIVKEFSANDVMIAEVGAFCNMLDPDSEKRRKNLEKVKNRLALAELMGARTCPNIAGSYSAHFWCGADPRNITEEFIDATVEKVPRSDRFRQTDAHHVFRSR